MNSLVPPVLVDSLLEDGIEKFPTDISLLTLYAEMADRSTDWKSAIGRWRNVEAACATDARPFVEQCNILREARLFDEADLLAKEGRVRFPSDLRLALSFGLVAHVRGDLDEALRRWSEVVSEFPDSLGAICRLSMVYCDLGRFDDAETVLVAADKKFPNHRDIAFQRATNATSAGEWLVAAGLWRTLHDRFPDDQVILNQYNRVIVELTNRIGDGNISEDSVRPFILSPLSSGINTRDLISQFESLGGDCEIGLLQRHFGCEPLDLFRWAGITEIVPLINILDNNLSDLIEPDAMHIELVGAETGKGEYILVFKNISLVMHSWIFSDDSRGLDELANQFKRRLIFLRRNFLDTAETGEKIFVFKDRHDVDQSAIIKLHDALNKFGSNRLLVVQRLRGKHYVEPIKLIRPGLAVGFLSRFGHPDDNNNVWNIDFAAWRFLLSVAISPKYLGNI